VPDDSDTAGGRDDADETAPTEYDKLVRDEIPRVIREDGATPVTHRVDGTAYERRLAAKLEEEAAEFAADRDPEELADVLEVVETLVETVGRDRVADARERKAAERGRFEEGVVLERVE
jgi:predicted house-cleaning noncanonical NTP pyrophosphatase (MazG superfamily)